MRRAQLSLFDYTTLPATDASILARITESYNRCVAHAGATEHNTLGARVRRENTTTILRAEMARLHARYIGLGSDRIVYGLGNYAIKIQYRWNYGHQNEAEFRASKSLPEYVPRAKRLFFNYPISVLVTERVKPLTKLQFEQERAKQWDRYFDIKARLADCHERNFGLRLSDNKLVMLDPGLED